MVSTADAVTGRLARNGISVCAAGAATALASVASVPVLYECLGPRRFGVWVALNGAMAVAALMDMGLGSAQVREVARALSEGCHRRARMVLGMGLVWTAGLGVLLMTVTLVYWPWLADWFDLGELSAQARGALLLLLVGLVLDGLGTPWRAVLEGAQRYAVVAQVTGGTVACGAAAAMIVAARGGGLMTLAACSAATSGIRALVLTAAARRHAPALKPTLRGMRRTDISAVAGYGSRIQVSNAAAVINNESDRLVLAAFSSPVAVAGFDVGSRLVNVLRLPPWSVLTTLFPAAVTAACGETRERLDRLYIVMTRYLSAYVAMATAMLVVSAEPLVRLWLGEDVPLASATIVILGLGCAVNITSGAAAVVTRSEGRPGRETRYALLAAVLNLALTVPLLRWLGPVGVPLSTAVAASAATVYFFVHFHRDSRRPFMPLVRAVGVPALAAAVAVALTWAAVPVLPEGPGRPGAALAVASRSGTALVITVGALAALGFFDRADRDRLRTAAQWLLPHRRKATSSDRRMT
ncbi:lipopolysaccharide biosynthesis protein [Streptomyces tailanensis]|uniref:lipopolysaccharide biosynthesis protein n=1 Tax=Streptomyces tailanensis TaxID=2569858 RepID=UPI00122E46B7|nr:MATE family efflux transporter [Streptomyces tailanensis]